MTQITLHIQNGTYHAAILIPDFLDEMPLETLKRLMILAVTDWQNREQVDEFAEVLRRYAEDKKLEAEAAAEQLKKDYIKTTGLWVSKARLAAIKQANEELTYTARQTARLAEKAEKLKIKLDELIKKYR